MSVLGRFTVLSLGLLLVAEPAFASVETPEPVTLPAPPSGKAEVVFFRPSNFVGRAISCAVSENATKVSSLPPGRFFVVVADAGRHTYSVSSEATDQVFFDLKPGQVSYVKCSVQMGFWVGRPKLDAAQDVEFTTKTWKSVDPSRIGPNVLTDAQLLAANTASANTSPAVAPLTPTASTMPVAFVAPAGSSATAPGSSATVPAVTAPTAPAH